MSFFRKLEFFSSKFSNRDLIESLIFFSLQIGINLFAEMHKKNLQNVIVGSCLKIGVQFSN